MSQPKGDGQFGVCSFQKPSPAGWWAPSFGGGTWGFQPLPRGTGTAQPPRGHHLLGHPPAATSPTGTGAMTATSRPARSGVGQGWGQQWRGQMEGDRQQKGQAGAIRTCCGGSGCPHLCLTAQVCGCPLPSAPGTGRAAQDGALAGEKGAAACRE